VSEPGDPASADPATGGGTESRTGADEVAGVGGVAGVDGVTGADDVAGVGGVAGVGDVGGPAVVVPDRVAGGRAPHPVSAARPRGRRRRPLWALGAATAMAAAVLLVIWLVPGTTPVPAPTPNTVRLALTGTGTAPGASANVVATEEGAGWKLALDISELPPAAEGTYYEGWLAGPDLVVPLGTFHMDNPGSVGLWSGLPLRGFDQVVVTVQQVGGELGPGEPVLAGDIPPQ
jgi:hypothetical protein